MKKLLYLLIIPFLLSCGDDNDDPTPPNSTDVVYTVTFNYNWNATNFPVDYPSGAHFSPLIGWSHKASFNYFATGKKPTAGIEIMAETGATATLKSELEAEISSGNGYKAYVGQGHSSGVGSVSIDITVNKDNSAISLVTMIAPSPDWYVGAIAVDLIENGEFINSKIIDGVIYDAGSDDGVTFTSANADTNPKKNISVFVDAPLGNGTTITPTFATISFKKKSN
ncbi:elongation factor Ts [Prolixibacteraceae bacterium JC049]|nr:elongation factor Ts [Prolixibacteraceae bacterium JC049]